MAEDEVTRVQSRSEADIFKYEKPPPITDGESKGSLSGRSGHGRGEQVSPAMTPNGPMDNATPPTVFVVRNCDETPESFDNTKRRSSLKARRASLTPPKFDQSLFGGINPQRTASAVSTGQSSARSAPRSARLLLSSRTHRGGMSYRLMQEDLSGCPRTTGLDAQAAARQAARKIADLLAAQAKKRAQEQLEEGDEDAAEEAEREADEKEGAAGSSPSSSDDPGLVVLRDSEEEGSRISRRDPLTKAEGKSFYHMGCGGHDTPSTKATSTNALSAYFESPIHSSRRLVALTPRAGHSSQKSVSQESFRPPGMEIDSSCIVFGEDINSFRPATLTEYRREAQGLVSVMKLVDESVIARNKGPRRAFIPDTRPFIVDSLPQVPESESGGFVSGLGRLFGFGSPSVQKKQPPPQHKQQRGDLQPMPAPAHPPVMLPETLYF
mmetsp:Transcript_45788/g.93718  ORF Transcript_45788/g.93718 Transcript_45788/m.93718 type:complete len:438 (-) Transcript_45788:135-1448(-)